MATRLVIVLILISVITPACAGSFAQDTSDSITPFIGLALVLPALHWSDGGREAAVSRADALLVSTAAVTLLKEMVHEWRPDHSNRKSFPSGHTAAAFALAGVLAEEHPKKKWLYYGVASLIGWSRVELDKHHWHDVALGAAIGYESSRWSVSGDNGTLLGRVFLRQF